MVPRCLLFCLVFSGILVRTEAEFSAWINNIIEKVRCWSSECSVLNSHWMKNDIKGLRVALARRLHGQHLAQRVVPIALESHLFQEQPSKALVMSFHGWPGGGKNYVAKFITDSLYELGRKSKYVHYFVTPLDFPDESKADIYKLELQDWIRGNVSVCERSLFVFDEIDKMPMGMIDVIKPFIDYHESIHGVDFRKSIFIFLSNTGGTEITRDMLSMWEEGKRREDITMEDMEHLIQLGAFNEKGGLHKSELIHHSLVNFYIPFLPLERKHVELCARDEISRQLKKDDPKMAKAIAEKVKYFPPDIQVFSTTGCKSISSKVAYHLGEKSYDSLFD